MCDQPSIAFDEIG